jgi:hypothetical protein
MLLSRLSTQIFGSGHPPRPNVLFSLPQMFENPGDAEDLFGRVLRLPFAGTLAAPHFSGTDPSKYFKLSSRQRMPPPRKNESFSRKSS